MEETKSHFADAEVIHAYSREQAIEDGNLIDVSEAAALNHFRYPMAFTRAAYGELIAAYSRWAGRPETDRLHEILGKLASAARHAPAKDGRIVMTFGTRDGEGVPYLLDVSAILGPGDDGKPVLTVCLPEDE